MLRALFGQPPRKDEGLLLEAKQAIGQYMHVLSLVAADQLRPQERRFILWGEGFLRSIDELEQSVYAAEQYGRTIKEGYVDQMPQDTREQYHRHLYYYKNALIRLFALLDKLGHFLNERLELQTERMKSRFSYFTVLRNMHRRQQHPGLEQQLYDLKVLHHEPLDRLRNQRNMEIHAINADLLDDLMKAAEQRYGGRVRPETDDIADNLDDIKVGSEMAMTSVAIAFRYVKNMPSVSDNRNRKHRKH